MFYKKAWCMIAVKPGSTKIEIYIVLISVKTSCDCDHVVLSALFDDDKHWNMLQMSITTLYHNNVVFSVEHGC